MLKIDGYGLKRNVRKLHWIKKLNKKLGIELVQKLHRNYIDFKDVSSDEMLTTTLGLKYKNLITKFYATFSYLNNLKKSYDDSIKIEDSDSAKKLAAEIEKGMISEFKGLLEWCSIHNTWALKSAARMLSPSVLNDFQENVTKARFGDRPISMTRGEHEKKLLELKEKKRKGLL